MDTNIFKLRFKYDIKLAKDLQRNINDFKIYVRRNDLPMILRLPQDKLILTIDIINFK